MVEVAAIPPSLCNRPAHDFQDRTQGAATPFHLPKKFSDTKTCVFWCKTTWGTMFTKGILPLVGEPDEYTEVSLY